MVNLFLSFFASFSERSGSFLLAGVTTHANPNIRGYLALISPITDDCSSNANKEIPPLKVTDCDNSKMSFPSALIKKKSAFVKYHVSRRMPDAVIMNACDVWKVSLSIFICFVFSGGSEARQDPVRLLVRGTFTPKISMQAGTFDLLHPISII